MEINYSDKPWVKILTWNFILFLTLSELHNYLSLSSNLYIMGGIITVQFLIITYKFPWGRYCDLKHEFLVSTDLDLIGINRLFSYLSKFLHFPYL